MVAKFGNGHHYLMVSGLYFCFYLTLKAVTIIYKIYLVILETIHDVFMQPIAIAKEEFQNTFAKWI